MLLCGEEFITRQKSIPLTAQMPYVLPYIYIKMTNTANKRKGGWWALSPLAVFLCLYLVTSLIVNDFYKVPITVAFLLSSCYAIALTRGLSLEKRVY